jgi:hypothetical protein
VPPAADRIIDNPIINSPYRVPEQYFRFDDKGITNEKVPGRRPSQYFIPVPRRRKRGQQIELEFAEFTADKIRQNDFVNQIRDRVDIWRKQRYPHVTPTTRRLLEHWTDPERDNPILFAQREAAETAIYLAESAQKAGDAWIRNQLNETNTACNLGLYRVALKMATGSGKTVVMAMLIAWQTLNKVAQSNDARFAKRFLGPRANGLPRTCAERIQFSRLLGLFGPTLPVLAGTARSSGVSALRCGSRRGTAPRAAIRAHPDPGSCPLTWPEPRAGRTEYPDLDGQRPDRHRADIRSLGTCPPVAHVALGPFVVCRNRTSRTDGRSG